MKPFLACIPSAFIVIVASPVFATSISIAPSVQTVSVGQIFSVDIDISNVADLYAFQFDLTFNPDLLSAVGITEGPLLPSGGTSVFTPGTIDNITGTIAFTTDSLIGPISSVNGSGPIAVAQFTSLAPGTSNIDLHNELFLDSTFASISVAASPASVISTGTAAVPEPDYMFLLALNLLVLWLWRWYGKAKWSS